MRERSARSEIADRINVLRKQAERAREEGAEHREAAGYAELAARAHDKLADEFTELLSAPL